MIKEKPSYLEGYFTVNEIAVATGRKPVSVRKDCRNKHKEMGAVKMGRDWFLPASAIDFIINLKPGRRRT